MIDKLHASLTCGSQVAGHGLIDELEPRGRHNARLDGVAVRQLAQQALSRRGWPAHPAGTSALPATTTSILFNEASNSGESCIGHLSGFLIIAPVVHVTL